MGRSATITGVELRRVLGPIVRSSTYRRWAYLILGGALLVPYLLFSTIAVPSVLPLVAGLGEAFVIGSLVTLLAMVASSFIPAVRVLEGAAVRELLDDPAPGASFGHTRSWPVRLRSSAMFLLHVLVGGVLSFLSLVLPIAVVLTAAAPFTGKVAIGSPEGVAVPKGWVSAWLPAVAVLAMVLLFFAVSAAGVLLSRAARTLLSLPAAERIAELERRAEQLAERNRLARELHDSVGHALSVVSIQAGAARRTFRQDPELAEKALLAIEDSARAAQDDLDYVLGVLREEPAARSVQAGLTELPELLSATRLAGIAVEADVDGDLAAVPPVVSREAYRILQECLTNVLRHAGKVPVELRLRVTGPGLELAVSNPVGSAKGAAGRPSGGRGLRGVAERVDILGGELSAGRAGEQWRVAVRLPVHGASGSGR